MVDRSSDSTPLLALRSRRRTAARSDWRPFLAVIATWARWATSSYSISSACARAYKTRSDFIVGLLVRRRQCKAGAIPGLDVSNPVRAKPDFEYTERRRTLIPRNINTHAVLLSSANIIPFPGKSSFVIGSKFARNSTKRFNSFSCQSWAIDSPEAVCDL